MANLKTRRSHWPRGLRHGSAVPRLLGLRVRIPPGEWMSVSCDSGQGSAVRIATAYGLGGPGIESRWWRDFPHQNRPALKSTQPPEQWVPGLSRG